MTTMYDIGDQPTVSGDFVDRFGAPGAPTAVTVLVLHPSGTVDTYNSPHASITLGTTTSFTFPAPLDAAGTWTVRMKGTAGAVTAGEIELKVRPSKFPSP